MKIAGWIAYLAFALSFLLLDLIAAAVLDYLFEGSAPTYVDFIVSFFVVTPLSLLAGRSFGRLTYMKLFATAVLVLAATYLMIFGMLDVIAAQNGGSYHLTNLIGLMGQWQLILSDALTLAAPLFWLHVLDRLTAFSSDRSAAA